MEIQILKQEYKDAIRTDPFLQAELATANNCSTFTLMRWRLNDDPMLTTATNLSIIRKSVGVDENIVLTEVIEVDHKKSVLVK